MLISIVLTCYNQARDIPEVQRHLVELAHKLSKEKLEFIYVDDGSSDETPKLLLQMSEADARVRGLRLSRNFGQQIAITAGLDQASGDVVVIMNVNDPPEAIVQMYARWLEGYHLVYGERENRFGKNVLGQWSSKPLLQSIKRGLPSPIPRNRSDFLLLDREVVRVLLQMPERDRFSRGHQSWAGYRQIAVPYSRAPHSVAETKTSLVRLGRSALSLRPLRTAAWLGLFVIVLALFGIARGWASLFDAILFMGGVQLVSLGAIDQYLDRLRDDGPKRSPYFVRERFGFRDDAKSISSEKRNLADRAVTDAA